MSPVSFIVSLSLLLGALLLAVTSALALTAVARCLGGWLKWPLAIVAKVVALFPLSAVIWAAIGVWIGGWRLPVSSLMPTSGELAHADFTTQLAEMIWWWMPPLFLLSLPLTAELLVRRLVGKRPLAAQVRRVGLFGIALLPVVEEAFHLPGAVAGVIPALHSAGSSSVLLAAWPLLLLAACWCGIVWAWPRTPAPWQPTAEDRIREGALAIGFSPQEVWKRHLLQEQIRRRIVCLCSAVAVGTSLWAAYGCPGNADRSQEIYAAFRVALNDPLAPLLAALPLTLCALFFWVLGRIILARQR